MNLKLIVLIYLVVIVVPTTTWGYFTNADSGELVPVDQYRLLIEPQVGHFNLSAHFDTGVTDSSQVRVSLGAGEDGSHFDFFYKNIPFPDYENQPAMGYKVGAVFASEKGDSLISLRLMPLISKIYEIGDNRLIPYASLPLTVSIHKSSSTTPIHAVIGTELSFDSVPDMQLGCEIGSSLKDSFSYASVFMSFYFEPMDHVTEKH